MSLYHSATGNCPITGKPVPNGYTWTDHDKPGAFNSCLSCCPGGESLMDSLARLERERKEERPSDARIKGPLAD